MPHAFSVSPLIQGFILGFTAAVCSIVVGYILADSCAEVAKLRGRRRARHDQAQAYPLLHGRWAALPNGHIERGYRERR